ncbi:MAG: 1-deoxy-D-xylulose-5-phosphate synthase [Clostridia bacterium]|nr:1-deoxy-D-xylulose-5-phosphate synthase [Clostridia bacterium]
MSDKVKLLRKQNIRELERTAEEIRLEIITATQKNGGHLASSLGAVELITAINRLIRPGVDRLVFDVGHQAYAHKLFTGRSLDALRREGGVSGFTTMSEGDDFGAGHAGTAISAALGFARAKKLKGETGWSICVVGDSSLTNGESYEALNDCGASGLPVMIILNDNEMSISQNVGAMAKYLSRVCRREPYLRFKRGVKQVLGVSEKLYSAAHKLKTSVKHIISGGSGVFESMGFNYVGPIDGHDMRALVETLRFCMTLDRPVLLHVATKKGMGYAPAEKDPTYYHGVSAPDDVMPSGHAACAKAVGDILVSLAAADASVCAITAAMPKNTGLEEFSRLFGDRLFDVGIAEEHALTMACAMAAGGLKPFAAIYSTFLQRSYDQMIVDMALQKLPVKLLIDKAGFSGADGATHNGLFDIAYMNQMPGVTLLSPRDIEQLRLCVLFAYSFDAPIAIRYARTLPEKIGENLGGVLSWQKMREGGDGAILAVGSMVETALEAAELLSQNGREVSVYDCRCVKPLDADVLISIKDMPILTMEEGMEPGGFGQSVSSFLAQNSDNRIRIKVLSAGDGFYPHSSRARQLESAHLTAKDAFDAFIQM